MLAVFKSIWADSWGPRLEHLLRNTLLLLHLPLPVDILLTFLPPAVLFHLPLLLFLSLHLPAVSHYVALELEV